MSSFFVSMFEEEIEQYREKGRKNGSFSVAESRTSGPLRTEGFSGRIRLDGTLFDPSPPPMLLYGSEQFNFPSSPSKSITNSMDKKYLKNAIELSKKSIAIGGFPVGALVVLNGEVIGKGISNGKQLKDATSHAEIEAIREASKFLDKRDLKGATIYSSLEPCLMCFSASYWAGVSRIVYACSKNKVSKQHYEGLHNLEELNQKNNRLIELIHLSELEEQALAIIENWEKALTPELPASTP